MKYLKQYEELSPEIYKRAANKLKNYGHNRRSDSLMQHYNSVLPIKIKNEWQELLSNYSKFGKLKIEFQHNGLEPHLLECNFRLNFDWKTYNLDIVIPEILEDLANGVINLAIDVNIIPSKEEDFELLQNLFHYDMPVAEYKLFSFVVRIIINNDDWVVSDFYLKNTTVAKPNDFTYKIVDRGSAGRLASLFKKAYDRDCEYPSGNQYNETLYDEINRIVFIEPGLSSETGISIEDVKKYIHNYLNPNDLFQY